MNDYTHVATMAFWYSIASTLVGFAASAVFVAVVVRRCGLRAARWVPAGIFFGPGFVLLGLMLLGPPVAREPGAEQHEPPPRSSRWVTR